VVLMLTFRCGLRRGEVFGLRLCDVHDQGGIYLHVRRYPGHRLKTPNATRTIRIDALLTTSERAILRRWIDKRIYEGGADRGTESNQSRLLARHGAPRDRASMAMSRSLLNRER
jgi:integrase